MRIALLIVVVAVLGFGGEWVYRSFLRPVDPLAPEVLSLAAHFDRSGIKVRPYAVRHGFRHSEVLSAAAFEISGFPLPVVVELSPNESAAAAHLAAVERGP